MNISINTERVLLNITGSFGNMNARFIKVIVRFPLPNQNQFLCTIETIQNDSLICSLIIPKQPVEGIISIDIRPERTLSKGDTDISGLTELTEKFNVYIPKPILLPNFGPATGGTKIRIQNLAFDNSSDLFSTMKIVLGKQQCHITEYDCFRVMSKCN
ncbi:unnamed protein product [Rotaria sordida]|uniref:Uncharacterized protein n=1 Tax=Rotaria sordida TaxID=392033 RepID=A0A820IR12_9BILA|nr:unnamed protein product [Rotaria sordida]